MCVYLGVDDCMHGWLCVYARWVTVWGDYMDVYGWMCDCVGRGGVYV